jgi:hypothetical protein
VKFESLCDLLKQGSLNKKEREHWRDNKKQLRNEKDRFLEQKNLLLNLLLTEKNKLIEQQVTYIMLLFFALKHGSVSTR